jgi:hypothetical protein
VILDDGWTLSVDKIGTVRFLMWDGMIRTVIDVRYVPSVRRSLVSLSELDSRGYEIRIRGGSIEVVRGDIVIIQDTRRCGIFEMVGTIEFTFTVISVDTPTWRIVGGDVITGCSEASMIETCHM